MSVAEINELIRNWVISGINSHMAVPAVENAVDNAIKKYWKDNAK